MLKRIYERLMNDNVEAASTGGVDNSSVDYSDMEGITSEDLDGLNKANDFEFDEEEAGDLLVDDKKEEEEDHEEASYPEGESPEDLLAELKGEEKEENTDDEQNIEGEGKEDNTQTYEVAGKDVTVAELIKSYESKGTITESQKAIDTAMADIEQQKEAFTAEMDTFRQENQKSVELSSQLDFVIPIIKRNNPELMAEFDEEFDNAIAYYKNPVVEQLQKEMVNLKAGITQKEDTTKLNEFFGEWAKATSGIIPKLAKHGINVDQNSIMKHWANGVDVKKAIFAEYGGMLEKAMTSRKTVDKARNAAKNRKAASLKGLSSKTKQPINHSEFADYGDIANYAVGLLKQ